MAPLIYLVDDQPLLMELFGHYIKKSKNTWQVECFSRPEAALAAARENKPDVVISEFAMPGLTGAAFLEAVRLVRPGTVRILVSSYADPQSLGNKLFAAHQYLAKPFSLADLCSMMQKAFNSLEAFENPALRTTVLSIRTLPAIPRIYYRLLGALEDSRCSYQDVVALLEQDEAICAKILQMANSPLFCRASRGQSIIDLLQAVTLLGTERTKAAVLSHQLFGSGSSLPQGFIPGSLSGHRWKTADLAFQIAGKMGVPEEWARDAYVAGLLHDLGRLVLMENFPAAYYQACQRDQKEKKPLTAVELETFKLRQSDVIGFLVSLWGMRQEVSSALIYQERPWDAPSPQALQTASALYLAHYKAHGLRPSEIFEQPAFNAEFLEAKNLLSLLETSPQT